MSREQILSSYLVRLSQSKNETKILLTNIKTGQALEFETWVAAWAFLDDVFKQSSAN